MATFGIVTLTIIIIAFFYVGNLLPVKQKIRVILLLNHIMKLITMNPILIRQYLTRAFAGRWWIKLSTVAS